MKNIHSNWDILKLRRGGKKGKNLAMSNFLKEKKPIWEFFIREFGQNILDVRKIDPIDGTRLHAILDIKIYDEDTDFDFEALDLITKPIIGHLTAALNDTKNLTNVNKRVLIIEEFNTQGLTGVTDDYFHEGEDPHLQRWNSFWVGEGDENKSAGELGKRGEGKITYHLMSGSSSVFALTNQEGSESDLLFGKSEFAKTHKIDSIDFDRVGYYCDKKIISTNEIQQIPITNKEAVKNFKKAFKIKREKKQSGTSWLIPYIPENLNNQQIIECFLKDYFVAIADQGLVLNINGQRIDSESLIDELDSCTHLEESEIKYIKWFVSSIRSGLETIAVKEDWFSHANESAKANSIDENILQTIVDDFEKGETLSLDVPIKIKKVDEEPYVGNIRIYLQRDFGLEKTQEKYIRDCLIIDKEKHLKDAAGKYLGAVLVKDPVIMEFLNNAEEASHVEWNQAILTRSQLYTDQMTTLSKVRKSMPAFAKLFNGELNERTDEPLEDLFYIPQYNMGGSKRNKKKPKKSVTPSAPKPFVVTQIEGGIVELTTGAGFSKIKLPCEVNIDFAYEPFAGGLAFAEYMHFDFDLSDKKQFPIVGSGFDLISSDLNRVEIIIKDANFNFMIDGFNDDKLLVKILFDDN